MEVLVVLLIVAAMVFDGCENSIVALFGGVVFALVVATALVTRRA